MSVYLVGAGPGDPGLITVRGLELVRSCDVLVYDRLVAPELVDEAPHHAWSSPATGSRRRINGCSSARPRGLDVVRLKGGDPRVRPRGRGGDRLPRAGIPTEIVPGVSSIAAVPAAAGIRSRTAASPTT